MLEESMGRGQTAIPLSNEFERSAANILVTYWLTRHHIAISAAVEHGHI